MIDKKYDAVISAKGAGQKPAPAFVLRMFRLERYGMQGLCLAEKVW